MEQHPTLHLTVLAIEKGGFGSPSTKVANLLVSNQIAKHYILYNYPL